MIRRDILPFERVTMYRNTDSMYGSVHRSTSIAGSLYGEFKKIGMRFFVYFLFLVKADQV